MKVLISGGFCTIGISLAKKFAKAGNNVTIIDASNGSDISYLKDEKIKLFDLPSSDPECEKIFGASRFEIVIYVPKYEYKLDLGHKAFTDEQILPGCDAPGIVNMLNLSRIFKIKKFVLLSSGEIYGNTDEIPANEQTKPNPVTVKGMSSYVMEYYCFRWSELHNMNILSLRTSDVYGFSAHKCPDHFEIDFVSGIVEKAINGKKIYVSGSKSTTKDFIYIDDFVEGAYNASVDKNCVGIFNLSSKTETRLSKLAEELSALNHPIKINYSQDNAAVAQRTCIDNSKITGQLNWQPKVDFTEGIKLILDNLKLESKNAVLYRKKNKTKLSRKQPGVIAYIENIFLFLVTAFIQWGNLFFNLKLPDLKIDYSIIYIIIMGITWGQTQAYIAMLLSAVLYVGMNLYTGSDIVTFIYTSDNLIRLAVYIIVGIITGYSIERKNRKLESQEIVIRNIQNKYGFLSDIYNETRIVKNELESQIIETEDSFSAIYKIIQEVDSLEIEKVFSGAISAIERIMKTNQVSIYTLSNTQNGNFMRLKARSKLLEDKIPNSIKVSDFKELREVIDTKSIFINRSLKTDIPVMIAPILDEKGVICVVSIHYATFENLTLHYENLFQTVLGLITNALKRAYYFEASLKDKRYIAKTRILTPHTFGKILDEVRNSKAELGMSYTLLKVDKNGFSLEQLSEKITRVIRDNDYIGMDSQDAVYILLSNTKNNYANIVIDRLNKVKVGAFLVIENFENE